MGHKVKSDFLVARANLAAGAARLFDFYGYFDAYNRCPNEAQADAMAILADWMVVGQDLEEAFAQYEAMAAKNVTPKVKHSEAVHVG